MGTDLELPSPSALGDKKLELGWHTWGGGRSALGSSYAGVGHGPGPP